MAGGVDRAADLVEHYWEVGYDHLIPSYVKYNWSWIQYYNVDVKAVLLAVVLVLFLIVYNVAKCLCYGSVNTSMLKQKKA